jgi:hypothetical protein
MTRAALSPGRTVRITSQLDEASREILRSVPQGFGGAFTRKAVERLVLALEAGQEAPEAGTGGDPRPYAWKAPEALLDRAYAFVAGGRYGDESKDRPYLHLGYLVRAAIMLLSTTAAPAAFPGGSPMEDTTSTRYDDDTHNAPASPLRVAGRAVGRGRGAGGYVMAIDGTTIDSFPAHSHQQQTGPPERSDLPKRATNPPPDAGAPGEQTH